jgi:hypothetical protein
MGNHRRWMPAVAVAVGIAFFVVGYVLGATHSPPLVSHSVPYAPAVARPSAALQAIPRNDIAASEAMLGRRGALMGGAAAAAAAVGTPAPALARTDYVDRPELLPSGPKVNVIDTVGLLSPFQTQELNKNIARIERLYGVKVRVLTQVYPQTPGLAVNDYWGFDDDTLMITVDNTFPNLLNFNLGLNIDLLAPNGRYWTSIRSKYGIEKYWRKYGEDEALLRCVENILDSLTKPDEMGMSMLMNV